MKMRSATIDDIEKIISLIKQNNLSRDDKSNSKTGLIEYPINPELIKKAINSKDSYISILEGEINEDKEKPEIIGVIIGYHKKFLKNPEFKDDQIVQKILEKYPYDFIYADLLVIDKKFQGKQYGRMLIMSFLDDTKKNTIVTAISHAPHKNEASLKLIKSFRFIQEDEITVYNGLTFGIYELDN